MYKVKHKIGARHHAGSNKLHLHLPGDESVSKDFYYIDDEILINTKRLPISFFLNMAKKSVVLKSKSNSSLKSKNSKARTKPENKVNVKVSERSRSDMRDRTKASNNIAKKTSKCVNKKHKDIKNASEKTTNRHLLCTRSATKKSQKKPATTCKTKLDKQKKTTIKEKDKIVDTVRQKTKIKKYFNELPLSTKPVARSRKCKRRMASLNAEAMVIAMYEDGTTPKRLRSQTDDSTASESNNLPDIDILKHDPISGKKSKTKTEKTLHVNTSAKTAIYKKKSFNEQAAAPSASSKCQTLKCRQKSSKMRSIPLTPTCTSKAKKPNTSKPVIEVAKKKLKNAQKPMSSKPKSRIRKPRSPREVVQQDQFVDTKVCKRIACLNAMAILAATTIKVEKRKHKPEHFLDDAGMSKTSLSSISVDQKKDDIERVEEEVKDIVESDTPIIIEPTSMQEPKQEKQEVVDLTKTPTPSSSGGTWTPGSKHTLASPSCYPEVVRDIIVPPVKRRSVERSQISIEPHHHVKPVQKNDTACVKLEFPQSTASVMRGYLASPGTPMFQPLQQLPHCQCQACAYRLNPMILQRSYQSAFSAVPPHHTYRPAGVSFGHGEFSCKSVVLSLVFRLKYTCVKYV